MLWGISREEIFENLLRLMRFGVYFETKMAIFIKKNYSLFALICARGSGAYATWENFENMVQFWYVLVYILIRLYLEN